MDKNSIIGLFIIAVMIIGYSIYTQPSQEQLEAQRIEQQQFADSVNAIEAKLKKESEASEAETQPEVTIDTLNQVQAAEKEIVAYGDLATARTGTEQNIIVENEKFIAVISSKGGVLKKLRLKEYQTYDSLPLLLFDDERSIQDFVFDYPGFGRVHFSDLYFEANKSSINIEGDKESELVLTLRGRQAGQELKMIYSLTGNTYDLKFRIESKGFNGFDNFNSQPLKLSWKVDGHKTEKYLPFQRQISSFFYKYKNEDRDWLSETSEDELTLEQPTSWVAFKQGFFSIVLFSDKGFNPNSSSLKIIPFGDEELAYSKTYLADLEIPTQENGNIEMNYFFGPNQLEVLEAYGDDLDRIINYGWSFIGWINRNVIFHLYNWFIGLGLSAGIAILMLTIVIKTVLAPLMFKNYKSSAKMRVLKPEVDKINKKFEGKDATQKQQATMALYRETGVNPLSGCLPMLIQMPVLYAMFRFFPSSIELRGVSFLWADDLSSYDSILQLGFTIPMYGDHISLFTLLMSITTLTYTWMSSGNMPETSQPGMPNMKVMMYIFPFMMIFFFNSYSSGLTYYYFLSTLISILQMWVIKEYFIDENKILAKLEANKAKPKKKSKFQQKLDEMARQQQKAKKK
jgi:YidC/Oxa1 family membrane protein insertase